jgi:hypothetical protein
LIRRRGLLPATARSARERREYATAWLLQAVVKLALAGALLVAAFQSFQLARQRAPASSRSLVMALGWILAGGALLSAARGAQDLRLARRAARIPVDAGPDSAPPSG